MKSFLPTSLFLLSLALAPGLHAQIGSTSQVGNGNFTANPVNTTETDNGSAITDWRLYNTSGLTGLITATIISGPTAGTQALQLNVNNNGYAPQGLYGFDNFANQTPVTFGQSYTFSFLASGTAGDTMAGGAPGDELSVTLAEFTNNGQTYAGSENQQFLTITPGYQTYSFTFTPTEADTTSIDVGFYPADADSTSSRAASNQTVDITNVMLVPEPGTVGLMTVSSFALLGWFSLRRKRTV